MNVSDYVIENLRLLGIDKIFGVNGGLIEPLLLSAYNKELEIIGCGSENQASLIAQSYGYEKGTFGVCFCISGAGQSNLINGLSTAFLDNKKLLVISGDNLSTNKERKNFQNTSSTSGIEFDKMIKSCTVYSKRLQNPEEIEEIFSKAIQKMNEHSRPVHIEIPKDLFESKISNINYLTMKRKKHKATKDDIQKISKIIKNKNVRFIVSDKFYDKKSLYNLLNLSSKHNIPIYESPTGKGVIPKDFENYKGCVGLFSNSNLENNDFYNIFLGNSLNEINTHGWSKELYNKKTILITDIKNKLENQNLEITNILSDLDFFIEKISQILKIKNSNSYIKNKKNTKNINFSKKNDKERVDPKNLFQIFNKNDKQKTISFFDIGNSLLWGVNIWNSDPIFKNDKIIQSSRIGVGLSSMGWGLGYSIGAALAHKDNDIQIYCFIGDGSILMSSQEIAIFKQYNLPITFIILNDSLLGTVYHGQKIATGYNFASSLPFCDFKKYFNSCGVDSIKIKNHSELKNKKELFDKKYKVIDVWIDKTKPSPVNSRVENIRLK